jgi:hypothetical protein
MSKKSSDIILLIPNHFRLWQKFYRAGLILLFFLAIISCGMKNSMKKTPDFGIANYQTAHYIYQDNLLTLAARIRPAEIPGSYLYEFLLINNGISPIPMNYYNDILTMTYENKIHSLGKLTKLREYPKSLEPEESQLIYFQLDGVFSPVVYQIKELVFKMGDKRYVLRRTPDAFWRNKESIF